MIQWIRALSCCLALTGALALVTTGCTPSKDAAKADANKKDKDKDKDKDDHGHGETGPHHGALAEWGETYHAEFTVDKAKKQAVVYILDGKAKFAPDLDVAKITKIKLTITDPKLVLDLKHDAARSGKEGIAFVATDDVFGKDAMFSGTISAEIQEEVKGKTKIVPYADKFEMKK